MAATTNVPVARVETRAGVSTASGGVQEAEAAVRGADQQIESARANLLAAQARQIEKETAATKAAHDVERFKTLAAKDEIPQQQFDAAVSQATGARGRGRRREVGHRRPPRPLSASPKSARVRHAARRHRRKPASRRRRPLRSSCRSPRRAPPSAEARVKQAQAALAAGGAEPAVHDDQGARPTASSAARPSRSDRSSRPASRCSRWCRWATSGSPRISRRRSCG